MISAVRIRLGRGNRGQQQVLDARREESRERQRDGASMPGRNSTYSVHDSASKH